MSNEILSVNDLKHDQKVYVVVGLTVMNGVVVETARETVCTSLKSEHKYQTVMGGMTNCDSPKEVRGNPALELTSRHRATVKLGFGNYYICDTILNDTVHICTTADAALEQVERNNQKLDESMQQMHHRMASPEINEVAKTFAID